MIGDWIVNEDRALDLFQDEDWKIFRLGTIR